MLKYKRILTILVTALLIISLGCFVASADQGAYVIFSNKNPNIGDIVTVTFRFYATGNIQYTVIYDAGSLQPLKHENSGTIRMQMTGSGRYSDQSISFRVLKKEKAYAGIKASTVDGRNGPIAGAYFNVGNQTVTTTAPTTTTTSTTTPTTSTTAPTTATAPTTTTETTTTETTTTETTTTHYSFYVEPPEKKKAGFTFAYAGLGIGVIMIIVVVFILLKRKESKNSKHTKRMQAVIKKKWEDQEKELSDLGGVYGIDLGAFQIGKKHNDDLD